MANPTRENCLLADKNSSPLVSTRQANVADAAATTVTAYTNTTIPVDLTFSSNAPTAADTQTISDGASPSVAETGQFMANVEDFMAQVNTDLVAYDARIAAAIVDLDLHKAKLNSILDVLEAHGLMVAS
jgi:hypothetical protein